MPTRFENGKLIHTCQYCGTKQLDDPQKTLPFLFLGYNCTDCGRNFRDDLDYDLIDSVQESLHRAHTAANAAPDSSSPKTD